jgi:hypothetical protein
LQLEKPKVVNLESGESSRQDSSTDASFLTDYRVLNVGFCDIPVKGSDSPEFPVFSDAMLKADRFLNNQNHSVVNELPILKIADNEDILCRHDICFEKVVMDEKANIPEIKNLLIGDDNGIENLACLDDNNICKIYVNPEFNKNDETVIEDFSKYHRRSQVCEISTIQLNDLSSKGRQDDEEILIFDDDADEKGKKTKNRKPSKKELNLKIDDNVNSKEEKTKKNRVLSIFSRFFNVFKSPFTRKKDNNKKSEIKQSLIVNEDFEEIEIVYAETASSTRLPWDVAKETKETEIRNRNVELGKNVYKVTDEEELGNLTPKQVAKLRKTKSKVNSNVKSTWKCCFF